ncbi:MAG TPA: cytochrome c3 family protein [Kofleriaceae bacterium]
MRRYPGDKLLIAFAVLGLVMLVAVPHARADFFSSSPGQLHTSHAELDKPDRCNDCHVDGTSVVSNQKCLDCHDHNDLRGRINAGKGFHASGLVKGKNCQGCHKDHKGRGFSEFLGWANIRGGEKGFDHDLTGWPLNGKHKNTDCGECHKARNKAGVKLYMGTDRLCGSAGCHNDDQPHKFQRKDMLACERCHTESVWKPPKQVQRFDHNDRKDAGMPILGSHKDVACTKCHTKAVFNLPFQDPDSCGNTGCHQSVHDKHLFNLKKCEECHSPTFKSLKQQKFDHSQNTRFDLGQAHSKIKCYDCHTKSLGENKPNGACAQCHAKDNKHKDRFAAFGSPTPACQTCHPSGGPKWTPNRFNHGAKTKFKLEFKHQEASCRQCHRGKSPSDFERFDFDPQKQCMSCHQHAKVHSDPQHPNGIYKNNQCLTCHLHAGDPTIRKGKANEIVDRAHNAVSGTFPLVKEHKPVACADCHTGRDKRGKTSFSGLKPNCDAAGQCHEDSLHKGSLGNKCLACHSPGTWDALNFNHDAEEFPDGTPGFKLKGEHRKSKCEDCHTPKRTFKDTPRTCAAEGCHAEDDAHKGRLGNKCEQCHLETGDNLFNHNTMSVFRLDGKHLQVRCADCHPSVTFKPRPTTCFGCHPEPAVHKGQYGTGCEQCHTTRTWEDIKPLHDVGDFSLRGQHGNIACERCHRDNRPLAGSGNLCINCHRQDDIHNNSLTPRCGECHTQWSFTPARFDHSRVGCNLTGLHRTIACFDCHKNGNFAAISAQCASCHRDDANRHQATNPATNHTAFNYCATNGVCHNTNSWTPQVPSNRESICR